MYRSYAMQQGLCDIPGDRTSHLSPTPRGGGLVFIAGWFALLAILFFYHFLPESYLWYFSPLLFVGFIGYWEDRFGLPVSLRFLAQVFCVGMSLFFLQEWGQSLQAVLPFQIPLVPCFVMTMLAMVWMTNLYNFMDGSDGIAAVEGIFIFSVAGWVLLQFSAYPLALLAWGLVALLGGFLVWNWPVAQVFMGDCGSYFLGFLVSLYAIISYKFFHVPLGFWIILTGLFWFDATLTLLRRMIAKEDWKRAHRKHAYQRLLQAGWKHQHVLLGACFINSLLAGLALCALKDREWHSLYVGMALVLLIVLYLVIERIKPMFGARV